MTPIRSAGLVLAAGALLGAAPLHAQDAEIVLQSTVNELTAGTAATYEIADIDQDGSLEAMVSYSEDCTIAGCLFSIVDVAADGELAEVAYQYGEAPTLVSNGTVIDANGIYFNWTGFALLPYFDTFEQLEFYSGTEEDRARILEIAPWMTTLRTYDIRVANVDLFGDEMPERFAWLDGPEYTVAQTQPYYVFDAEGEIVTNGAFLDRPFLFNLSDRKAAALITHNGAGFETKILE